MLQPLLRIDDFCFHGHRLPTCAITAAFVLSVMSTSSCLENGIARTPPMGWSTFNQFGGEWDINLIKAIADSMVANGLRDCGYQYINVDGNDDGNTPYWPSRTGFVNWAKPFADYVHGKGFKFGVYTSELANPQTVASDLVAATVDFIKIDAWTTPITSSQWTAMRDALVGCGRPICFSIHNGDRVLNPAISNMSRTGPDVEATWSSELGDFDQNYFSLSSSGPGAWADPDMMEVGCRADNGFVLTDAENRALFTMFCMMASPLIAGYDFSQTGPVSTRAHHVLAVSIHSNTEVIALDQDVLGKPGRRIKGQGAMEVWVKDLGNGDKGVAFFNRTSSSGTGSISQAELGLSGTVYVRDLWLHANQANFTSGNFTRTVASHSAEVFRMSTSQITAVDDLRKMDRSIAWLRSNGVDLFPQKLVPSVLSGMVPGVRAFDVRGRMVVPKTALTGPAALMVRRNSLE